VPQAIRNRDVVRLQQQGIALWCASINTETKLISKSQFKLRINCDLATTDEPLQSLGWSSSASQQVCSSKMLFFVLLESLLSW
jgi:hypothetical protein